MPEKSGLLPGFEIAKWAGKTQYFMRVCGFLPIYPLYFVTNCDKKFKEIYKYVKKSGYLTTSIERRFLESIHRPYHKIQSKSIGKSKNSVSFLPGLWYTKSVTQSNRV